MSAHTRIIVLVMIPFCVAGCGTVGNIVWSGPPAAADHMAPYGGVYRDVCVARDCTEDAMSAKTFREFTSSAAIVLFAAIDLPLSLVGDTVTLPITILSATAKEGNSPPSGEAEGPAPNADRDNPRPFGGSVLEYIPSQQ
jgi:uncharacterized protein YceK